MAKYSSFVYSTAKYGTGSAGTQPTHTGDYLWSLLIRWDADWVNEAGRCVGVRGNRGRKFYVSQGADTFEPVQPGQFYFTLDNFDGRYDPYNGSSPLTGHILPGRAVQFRVKVLANDHAYSIFTGRIRDIRPISGVNQVEVLVVDALQWLADQDITIPVAYNIKVDQAIAHTLNAAEYPYPVSLGASNCPITYFDPDEANALDTIRALTDAGIGTAFVDTSGALKYYDLTKTGLTTHTLDQAVLLKEIVVTQPWETVRNKITTIANRFGYGPLEEVWRMDEPVFVAAGSSKTFKIEFEPAKVIQPVRDVDYSSAFTFQNFVPGVGYGSIHYFFTVALANITSTGATVVVTNNETDPLYMTWLTIRGNKLINKKLTFPSTDAASISAYGPRRFRIDSPWLQDRGFADAYAILLKNFLKSPSKSPVIEIETREDGFAIELFDRVTLTSGKLGISNTFDVGGVDFEWLNETGQGFRQILYLQNILYSTATIIPQPFYPFLPPVPPTTPPGGPPVTPPWVATQTCLDPIVSSGPTGPQSWGGGVIDNLRPSSTFAVQRWFRSIYHPVRTYIEVDALWESLIDGVWVPESTYDFESITAYNNLGQPVASGALNGAMVADGVRRYYFNNTNPYYIGTLTFALPSASAPRTYEPGSYTGLSIVDAAGDVNGVEILGLSAGQWYCLESNGIYKSGPESWKDCTLFVLKLGSGAWEGAWGWWMVTPTTSNSGGVESADFPHFEFIDETHVRVFFKMTTGLTFVACGTNYPNNTGDDSGSLAALFYNALVTGGDKRVTIRSIKIYNYCEGDPA